MLRRSLTAALFAALLLFMPQQAGHTSQGNQVLPSTGTYTGVQFSNLISEAIAALNSCNSGTSAPANATGAAAVAGQCWDDTSSTPTVRKVYDGASWISIGAIDASNHIWIPQLGGGTTTLASAATVDLCSVPQTYIFVSGTTTITSFGTSTCQVGTVKIVRFLGALSITYDLSTLTIPGSDDLAIAAGDTVIAAKATSSRWDVVAPTAPPAAPAAAADANPVGTMLTYGGFSLPTNYEWCSGSTISRTTYADYLAAVTSTQSVTRTNGSPTLSGFSSTEQFAAGMNIEGTGIPAGATLLSKTSTTVTLSANATSSGTSNATVFAHGNGNGSSTVSLPDARGRVLAGRDDLGGTAASRLTSAAPNSCAASGLGIACGAQSGTLTEAQLPSVSKTVTISVSGTTGGGGSHQHFVARAMGGAQGNADLTASNTLADQGAHASSSAEYRYTLTGNSNAANVGETNTVANHTHTFSDSGSDTVSFGSGTAHTRLQPTLVTNCIVKVQ